MLRKLFLLCGALVLVATIALAALLGVGKAASTNSCNLIGTNQSDCFTISAPLYVTSGQTGLATGKFQNIVGTATTTHTVITMVLPSGTSATSVSSSPSATCSTAPFTQTVSCSFGAVKSGATVRMYVQFTSSAAAGGDPLVIQGTVSFDEGNGTNGNDAFPAQSSFLSVAGTDHAGFCTTATQKLVKNKPAALISTTDSSGQTTTIQSLATLANGHNEPCTPIAAGVDPAPSPGPGKPTTHVSVVAFQTTGTVTLLFPFSELSGRDASTFQLLELSILDGTSWLPVGSCPTIAAGTDTCVVTQKNVKINGVNYVEDDLNVVGQPPDGRYGG